jgi:ergothioneine biosynthesis protein EgtB
MPSAEHIVQKQFNATHHGLVNRLHQARVRSDELFRLVRPDCLYERPIPERHRIIFYVGHLEAFDWNLLRHAILGTTSLHPEFNRLFAFGIDPVGGGLPSDLPADWPSLSVVKSYVGEVRAALDVGLTNGRAEATGSFVHGGCSLDTLLNVAIEHRLMHIETLAYMLHQLPLEKKEQQSATQSLETGAVTHRSVEIPGGIAALGLHRSSGIFGWDNEYESCNVDVPAFVIDRYKVTNQKFIEFMQAGGYQTRALWSTEDWDWISANAIEHPVLWRNAGEVWMYRTMFAEVPLPLDWPVYVSHAEASAYARWAGKLLPTEAEWHRAAYGSQDGRERKYPWGNSPPNSRLGNFDLFRWNPTPVNAFPEGQSAFGVADILGNGWEWTSTVFAPFLGFEPFPFYPGYSADFFDGKHFVIKGGSPRTAACMLRSSFRNWFQAHYQYVYAGFRCVSH